MRDPRAANVVLAVLDGSEESPETRRRALSALIRLDPQGIFVNIEEIGVRLRYLPPAQ